MTEQGDTMAELPYAVDIAWLNAQAFPDRAEEILGDLRVRIRRLISDSARQVTEAKAAAARFQEQAEREAFSARRYIEKALEGVVRVPLADELDPHGYYVYLLWGSDRERPLYVGQTTNLFARLGAHMNDRTKRYQTERITVLRCSSQEVMESTEWSLIRLHQPPMNSMGIGPGGDRREPHARATGPTRKDRRTHKVGPRT